MNTLSTSYGLIETYLFLLRLSPESPPHLSSSSISPSPSSCLPRASALPLSLPLSHPAHVLLPLSSRWLDHAGLRRRLERRLVTPATLPFLCPRIIDLLFSHFHIFSHGRKGIWGSWICSLTQSKVCKWICLIRFFLFHMS
jgi:hypothetical protein